MSQWALIDRYVTPPGNFQYKQSETGFTVVAPTWNDLVREVKKHRDGNVIPIGLNFERELEQQNCERLVAINSANFVTAYDPPQKLPLPRDEWPVWAKTLATQRADSDVGVGDTAERVFGAFGGDIFKRWYKTIFGEECSCRVKQASWNMLYGYKPSD